MLISGDGLMHRVEQTASGVICLPYTPDLQAVEQGPAAKQLKAQLALREAAAWPHHQGLAGLS